MGRKTHESIGKALPGRLNIIITSNKQYQAPGCSIASSLKEAIQLAKTKDKQEIFIIGGSMVYREALPLADKLYLTLIKGVYQAKVFFPDYSNFSKIVNKVERQYGKIEYTIYELQKEN
jgi:dihydrofolate reductase